MDRESFRCWKATQAPLTSKIMPKPDWLIEQNRQWRKIYQKDEQVASEDDEDDGSDQGDDSTDTEDETEGRREGKESWTSLTDSNLLEVIGVSL